MLKNVNDITLRPKNSQTAFIRLSNVAFSASRATKTLFICPTTVANSVKQDVLFFALQPFQDKKKLESRTLSYPLSCSALVCSTAVLYCRRNRNYLRMYFKGSCLILTAANMERERAKVFYKPAAICCCLIPPKD